jgi:hypothetical protein
MKILTLWKNGSLNSIYFINEGKNVRIEYGLAGLPQSTKIVPKSEADWIYRWECDFGYKPGFAG